MNRWLAALPLVTLAALALMFGAYSLNRDPKVVPQALVGQALPALPLPSLDDGRTQVLTEVIQGPALVNVYASWCAPCEIEHPVLVQLKARGVRIIGVSYKDAPENSLAFLQRLGDPYAARLVDRNGRAGIELGVTGVPETYLVGADGMIVAKHSGPLTPETAEALLARIPR